MTWFFRDHTADIAIVCRAHTLKSLIQEMVKALSQVQGEVPPGIEKKCIQNVPVKGRINFTDLQDLTWEFCDMLNSFLSDAGSRSALLLKLEPLELLEGRNLIKYEGIVKMVPWEHVTEKKTEIKAVTYSGAYLVKKGFYREWQICVDV